MKTCDVFTKTIFNLLFFYLGIKMVHLDSHPDLAYPDSLRADDCFDKTILYDQLDIADWILPLAYQGHLRHLVWVHPPWAQQIGDVKSSFSVGKHTQNGKLKYVSVLFP